MFRAVDCFHDNKGASIHLTSKVSAETPSLGNVPSTTMDLFPSERMHYFLFCFRVLLLNKKQIKQNKNCR